MTKEEREYMFSLWAATDSSDARQNYKIRREFREREQKAQDELVAKYGDEEVSKLYIEYDVKR